jgi:hypothetical protein
MSSDRISCNDDADGGIELPQSDHQEKLTGAEMSALFRRLAVVAVASALTAIAGAQTFGAMQIVGGVHVASMFHGHVGPTYVSFTPATLVGCNANTGGYLSTSWSSVMTPDPHSHAVQIAMLLAAKAADSTVEVRYRINSQGTGWDKCTIDAIWVQ